MDKITSYKNIIILVFLMMCTILCSCNEDTYEYITESYTIDNELNECYCVDYTEKPGFPDHSLEIKISIQNETIIDYTTRFKLQLLPTDIVYLFENDDNEYYYIANEVSSSIVMKNNCSTEFKYIDNYFDLDVNFADPSNNFISDYIKLAGYMRTKLTEQDIIEKFQTCGYDYNKVLQLYNLR